MDDWRNRIATELLGKSVASAGDRSAFAPDAATAVVIALGVARAEVAYFLALGRTHSLPMTGNAQGDDVWLQLGETRLRFAYDRARHEIAAQVDAGNREEIVIAWDDARRVVRTPVDEAFDMRSFVRSAIEETIAAWKANPVPLPPAQWEPPQRAVIHGAPGYVPPPATPLLAATTTPDSPRNDK